MEPAWDPENAKSIVPNQHIPKDPRIENLSNEFSGWMVVEIRVPTAVVSVFDEGEQKVLDPARTPLFSFVADPQWTLLQQFEDGDEDVYRFGWPETIPALGQTPPIFEEVVVANHAEAQGPIPGLKPSRPRATASNPRAYRMSLPHGTPTRSRMASGMANLIPFML